MLPLLVVTAVVAAMATSLGGSAHVVAARIAISLAPRTLDLVAIGASAGALVATALVLGGRLAIDFRLVKSPNERGRGDLIGIAIAAGIGVVGHTLLETLAREMAATAIGAGLGLLTTSVAVGSIGIARAPISRFASPAAGALAGAGLAMGALPGGAPIALALAALVWCGVAAIDAFEIAALAALPLHGAALYRALDEPALSAASFDPTSTAAAAAAGAIAAALGLLALRRLTAAGSIAGTALYTATLGFALLGYAFVAAP